MNKIKNICGDKTYAATCDANRNATGIPTWYGVWGVIDGSTKSFTWMSTESAIKEVLKNE
jgi:hypothetical protein